MNSNAAELARFFTLSPDLLCIAGTDGFFKTLSPAWAHTLGWTTEELLKRPYLDFVHPDDRDETIREANAIGAGRTTITFENRYRCRDGSYKWLQWTAVLFAEEQRIYAIARDVTTLKAVELDLRAARKEAERATQAKNVFLSRMSHDLRTPLNAILGFAQLLDMDNLTVEQTENVRQVLKGGRHLLDLINEVLDIARIESGHLSLSPESVSVGEAIRSVIEFATPLATPREIALTMTPIPADDLAVRADRQRLKQILLNLLSNAVKYNRPGGRVTVDVEMGAPGRLRINVRDTGAGIPAAKIELLFQPFERLGAEQTGVEGTGLGLTLSRALAEAMGGTLGVESIVDRGSTFWLELILADPAPRAASAPPEGTSVSAVPDSTGTILYIEDNASNVRLMERVLQQRPGVVLVHAPQGDTGLTLARERRPDVILLDLHLPDMSGEEVLRHLWEEPVCRSIPVVVMTADATPGLTRRLKAAGARGFLTKPIDVRGVLGLLDSLLNEGPRGSAA